MLKLGSKLTAFFDELAKIAGPVQAGAEFLGKRKAHILNALKSVPTRQVVTSPSAVQGELGRMRSLMTSPTPMPTMPGM
jgi:hypothetical protein